MFHYMHVTIMVLEAYMLVYVCVNEVNIIKFCIVYKIYILHVL